MNKTPERKSNLSRILRTTTAALVIVACIAGVLTGCKDNTDVPGENLSPQLTQAWKSTPSDIEGMSKWDKYAAGLSLAAGADTDGDGLTDKEEIEVHHTDPLKVSTAGDLYSDAYKVQSGMDPAKAYDYEGTQHFAHNSCPEVILNAVCPTDFNAVVTPVTNVDLLMGLQIYAAYRVYNYSGKFSVDLSDVLRREDLKLSDIAVYVDDGNELDSYSFTKSGNVLTLKKTFDPDSTYTVYCVEKNFLRFAAANLVSSDILGSTSELLDPITDIFPSEEPDEITGAGLVILSPILTEFLGVPVVVQYEDLGDDADNETLADMICADMVDYLVMPKSVSEYDFQRNKSNYYEIQFVYKILQDYVPFFDATGVEDFAPQHIFFLFYSYEDNKNGTDSSDSMEGLEGIEDWDDFLNNSEQRPEIDTVSGFHPLWDTLPFGNFKTSFSPDGSCAGIAYLTTYLYNQNDFPNRSTAATWESQVQWDLTKDLENYTLTTPGLRDYKSESFVRDHSTDGLTLSENLSSGEQEFAKMIADAYLAGNENAEFICYELFGGDFSTVEQDYAVIQSAMNYLKSGKILTVYLGMTDGSRHAVNIYDYSISEENPDIVCFSVYDCNYPNYNTGDAPMSDTGFTLQVEKKLQLNGTSWTFDYDFFPLEDRSYGATSNPNISNNNLILILDEYGHLLND